MSTWTVRVLYDPQGSEQVQIEVVSNQSHVRACSKARQVVCALGWNLDDCYSDDDEFFQPMEA